MPHNASQSNVCKFVALNSLRIGQGEEYFKSPLEKKETKRPQKKQRPIMTYLRLVQACVICCKKNAIDRLVSIYFTTFYASKIQHNLPVRFTQPGLKNIHLCLFFGSASTSCLRMSDLTETNVQFRSMRND